MVLLRAVGLERPTNRVTVASKGLTWTRKGARAAALVLY